MKRFQKLHFGILPILSALLLLMSFFTDSYYLKSGSMEPMLPVGSVVVTTRLLKPKIGSVCAYQHNRMIIIHRIIAEDADSFRFQGDANNTADPYPVRKDQIQGRLIFYIPAIHLFYSQEDFS